MSPFSSTGFMLLPVVLLITLLSVVGIMVNHEAALGTKRVASSLEAQQVDYVAQAGLANAAWRMQQSACGGDLTVPATALGYDNYSATVTAGGSTTAYTLSVDQDAWIRNDQPDTNNGSNADAHIRFETGNIEQPLYRFDLSSLPSGAQINSASAYFYIKNPGGEHPEGPVTVHTVTSDWTEAGVTWNSFDGGYDWTVLDTIPAQALNGVWVGVNVTSQVQAWVNGAPNYGVLLNSTAEGVYAKYISREGSAAQHPRLEVVVGSAPASPAAIQATGTLATGVTRTLNRPATPVHQPPGTALLQPGASAGEDTYLNDGPQSGNNYDGNDFITVSGNNSKDHALLRFDLSSIPVGATVRSAKLVLNLETIGSGNSGVAQVHRVQSPWIEAEATWDDQQTATAWSTPGGDYDEMPVATATIDAASPGPVEWDVTGLVSAWVAGDSNNNGFLLTADSTINRAQFHSSDSYAPDKYPQLTVTYACECGIGCLAPQGSGKLLLVVSNAVFPEPHDVIKKALFESWGYTVDYLSDGASQSTYDSMLASHDVVYISDSVSSSTIGLKLTNAVIGVVSEKGNHNLELDIANGKGTQVGGTVDITDTSHYITQPFAGGALAIYDADMELLTMPVDQAAGLQSLASAGGVESLVVLEEGAIGLGGGPIAGRRVVLPVGRVENFNWNYLNNNGRLIVQRAIAWGMKADAGSGSSLLMVVVDPGSLTAQEAAKRTLIESWGYTVSLINQSDPQSTYDTALASSDVVFVGEDVASSQVGDKLNAATIGVVIEEDNLSDELGLSDGIAWESGTDIEINDNSHYITSPFALGALNVFSSSEALAYATPALAPDLDTLASSASGFGVVALETGATTVAGGPAAGRRAMLPWGGNDMDVNNLTADGLMLFERALAWGAGAVTPPLVLMVVGDPDNLTLEQADKKALIESWGYYVQHIATAEPQSAFDSAAAGVDVVYIPELGTTPMSELGTKADNLAAPVITEEPRRAVKMGSFLLDPFVDSDTVTITDNSHYITETLPLGPVVVSSTVQTLWRVGGTLAPHLQVLGELTGGVRGLAVVEEGDLLNDGNPAPARRVKLPWGAYEFDVKLLTADGLLIFQRAFEWAAAERSDPIAHWKLDDGAGTAVADSAGNNDGTFVSTPDWVAGRIDGGLDFDGADDYVDTGSFDVAGSGLTLSGWFNAEALTSTDGRIVSKAVGTSEQDAVWQLSYVDAGAEHFIRMRVKAGGTTDTLADSSVALSTGQWYFAVATYRNATGEMKLYLDGTEVANAMHPVGGAVDADPGANVAIGANGTAERFFDGILDDVRVYDRALEAVEIGELYAEGRGSGAAAYTEMHAPWSASTPDNWETADLGAFGVPANAVVEVAVINTATSAQRWGGVRAAGSSLDRRLLLHEAEGGGADAVTMHVQANGSSQIQHYSDNTGQISFVLLGYWTGAVYVEGFNSFKAGGSNSWLEHNLGAYGVGANQVAEIVIANTNTSRERLAGVRPSGTGFQRRINLHEAESGGIDAASMMVETDASSIAEFYAQSDTNVDFYVVGYWSTPPGTYVETGGVHGQASAASTWEQADLSAFGVPANSVAHFLMSNEMSSFERELGVRGVGLTSHRVVLLQEAEAGGSDNSTMHVNVDSSSQIEWYSASGTSDRYFYPIGWWVLD